MTDPKKQHVIGKKPIVAERTLTERSFCEIDQYYYSEMFTCPICFGADRERERIIKLLDPEVARHYELGLDASAAYLQQTIALIKGNQK